MIAAATLHGLGGEPWSAQPPVMDGYRSFIESKVSFARYASVAGRGEGGITRTPS